MADKEATTDGSFDSSVEIVESDSHKNTSGLPGDLEKADTRAALSQQKIITAQDWTGPDDPENPQNW
jgi:hypothetical protein